VRLSPEERHQQEYYRDARTKGYYGDIWQSVGKCVFCDLRDKYIVYEENGIVMTVPLYAYIDGNVMIIPRRHVQSVKELTSEEWQTVRKLMYIAKKLIRAVHGIKGVQYLVRDGGPEAQSTVAHLHMHCIPFDAPDLSVWNYRQLKYTPLENAELFRNRRAEIEKLSKRFEDKYGAA
jgi:diadenosine tetraphosphate (Ap4A) HIT family hydrolase